MNWLLQKTIILFPYHKSSFCNYAGIIGQSCNYRKHKQLFNDVQAGKSVVITLHSHYKQTAQVDVCYLTKIISNQDMLNFWAQIKFEARLQKLRLWNINRQLSVVLIRNIYLKLQILVLWSLGQYCGCEMNKITKFSSFSSWTMKLMSMTF